MGNDFEPSIFTEVERLGDSSYGVASVRIPRYILEDALHSNLHPCASIQQHVCNVLLQAVIWTRLNCNTYTFGLTLLRIGNCLVNVVGGVSRKSIMEVSDEVVSVFLIQGHEGTTHYDEFYLVCVVAESFELLNTVFRLEVRVVSGSDGTH